MNKRINEQTKERKNGQRDGWSETDSEDRAKSYDVIAHSVIGGFLAEADEA